MDIVDLDNVYKIMNQTDGDFVRFLQTNGCLKSVFRCKVRICRKRCKKQYSILKGSFFANTHLPVRKVFLLMWFWACEIPIRSVESLTGISKSGVIKQFRSFRDVVTWKILQDENLFVLGGVGHVVQIDEFVITKQKHRPDQVVSEKWVLAIYDINLKIGYIAYIPNRTAETILPIVQKIVMCSSEIWTDEWSSYTGLHRLGYTHKTVDHSQYFQDPETGVYTNYVEGFWLVLRRYLRRLGVIGSPYLPEYIDVFLWKQMYGKTRTERMRNLMSHIQEKY